MVEKGTEKVAVELPQLDESCAPAKGWPLLDVAALVEAGAVCTSSEVNAASANSTNCQAFLESAIWLDVFRGSGLLRSCSGGILAKGQQRKRPEKKRRLF